MGIVQVLSCLYFIITIVLIFKRNTVGNIYIGYGLLTFLFIIGYSSIPAIPPYMQNIAIFIVFSLIIVLFGLTFGIIMTLFNKSNKVSRIAAITSSTLLIVLLFNARGFLTYMYIPVLLYMLQDYTYKMMNNTNNSQQKSFIFRK